MSPTARLLVVEDNPSDIDLLLRLLRRSGLATDPVVSDDIDEIRRLLAGGTFEAVLTDHQLGAFTASDVLAAVAALGLDVPVLVVSGAVGEDRAAALMREGASDFIRKDNLSRLLPALQRELREAEGRRQLAEATERRARSESLLRFVVELSGDSFWEWDLATGFVTWSDTFLALCGPGNQPASEIGAWLDRIHPEDRGDAKHGIEAAIASAGGHWSGTFRFHRGNGTWALLMSRCFVVRDNGRPVRVIGAMADITERQSLLERQRVFTALVDQAGESIGVIDPDDGRFVEFNAAAHLSLGYTEEEFSSRSVFDIDCQFSPEEITRHLQELRSVERQDLRTRHRAKDGSVREVRIHSRPIRILGRTYLAAVWQDLTERMAIEADLRQAQKMEVMGQIAGGVAHDFNNILAVMRLQLDVARMRPDLPANAREVVDSLSGMVDRATNLTRRLMSISRKASPKFEDFLLDDALDDLISVSRRILGAGIEIRRLRSTLKPVVNADRSIMDQVFMNLLVNARDAMPDGGLLTVETCPGEAAAAEASGETGRRFVQIRISDTGVGMSKETLARLQEPFFTTKEPGKGTGLGLGTARRSLQEHGGWMSVASEEGRGTTFTLHLPMAETATAAAAMPSRPAVLLVIGDAQLRMLARKILEKVGCQVHACANAAETVRVLESGPHNLELALLPAGMTLPDSDTLLSARLRKQHPDLPLLLAYWPESEAFPTAKDRARPLEMPFSVQSLTTCVRDLLPDRLAGASVPVPAGA